MAEPGEPGNDGDTGTHQPEDDPESSLRAAFARAPDEGISVPELVTITGMSRRWV